MYISHYCYSKYVFHYFILFILVTFYISDCGRTVPGIAKGTVTPRVFITSGTGEKLRGICVYFIRVKMDIALSIKNIHEVKL